MNNNDRTLHISMSGSQGKNTRVWTPMQVTWSAFLDYLDKPQQIAVTSSEYGQMDKASKSNVKNMLPGFVGGTCDGGSRKKADISSRSMVTLDYEGMTAADLPGILDKIRDFPYTVSWYTTLSHTPDRPRIRIIVPLLDDIVRSETKAIEEYEPLARILAHTFGIRFCDPASFNINQFMYMPGQLKHGEYLHGQHGGDFLPVMNYLEEMYPDWKDCQNWPIVPDKEDKQIRKQIEDKKAAMEKPSTKGGWIGAFCAAHNILDAIKTFIPDAYVETKEPNRLTYTGGTTTGGAVLYDGGQFLFSFHATDPARGQLCNSFDLIRIHKFGSLDADADPDLPMNRLPSYKAMMDFVRNESGTKKYKTQQDFPEMDSIPYDGNDFPETLEDMLALEARQEKQQPGQKPDQQPEKGSRKRKIAKGDFDRTDRGAYKGTPHNFYLAMGGLPEFRGKIHRDTFSQDIVTAGGLPWNSDKALRTWTGEDDAGLIQYLGERLDVTVEPGKLRTALVNIAADNKINVLQDWLDGLVWDGVPRLDTVMPWCLGADDTPYTRAAMRKWLCGAVARIMQPGCKFDYTLLLIGAGGIGKSHFFEVLGGDYYSNSLYTFTGKEAFESVQGNVIMEIAELYAYGKSNIDAVKNFLTSRVDKFRAAYSPSKGIFKRTCVFGATTNDYHALKGDAAGLRRFWPIVCHAKDASKVWNELQKVRNQLWAEAKYRYEHGEILTMDTDQALKEAAREAQQGSVRIDPWTPSIEDYLDAQLPNNWDSLSQAARIAFFQSDQGQLEDDIVDPHIRQRVCSKEIAFECFGFTEDEYSVHRNRIIAIMDNMPGWAKYDSGQRFGCYGTQKNGYYRISKNE